MIQTQPMFYAMAKSYEIPSLVLPIIVAVVMHFISIRRDLCFVLVQKIYLAKPQTTARKVVNIALLMDSVKIILLVLMIPIVQMGIML